MATASASCGPGAGPQFRRQGHDLDLALQRAHRGMIENFERERGTAAFAGIDDQNVDTAENRGLKRNAGAAVPAEFRCNIDEPGAVHHLVDERAVACGETVRPEHHRLRPRRRRKRRMGRKLRIHLGDQGLPRPGDIERARDLRDLRTGLGKTLRHAEIEHRTALPFEEVDRAARCVHT